MVTQKYITGKNIVTQARTWLGTPWHHAARCKNAGVDCVGLLVGVLQEVGYPVQDFAAYDLGDQFSELLRRIELHADPVADGDVRAGDILVFRARLMYNHCGWANGAGGVIHAWRSVGKVVEHPLDAHWQGWIAGRYRLRELALFPDREGIDRGAR